MKNKVDLENTLLEVEREINENPDKNKSIELRQKQLELKQTQISMENDDKKEDAQRKMAWLSLGGMLLYPLMIVITTLFGIGTAATVLGSMAPTYFVSVAAIIMAFYGKEAYLKKN